MRGLITAVAAVAACGPSLAPRREFSPPPPLPAAPGPRTQAVAPLALPAVEGGLILATGADGSATVVPLRAGPQRRELPPPGRAERLAVVVATAADGGGVELATGDVTPAAAAAQWLALAAAARALGTDPASIRVRVEGAGPIELSSAAPLAVAALAGLTGARLDASVAVDGLVNPDGSVATAARASAAPDLAAAYARATGAALPATRPLDAADMAIDPPAADVLAAQYAAWRAALGPHWSALLAAKNRSLPAPLHALVEQALASGAAAERLQREARVAAAYDRIVEASIAASAAATLLRLIDLVAAGDVDGAGTALAGELDVGAPAHAALERARAAPADSVGALLATASAYPRAVAASAASARAGEQAPAARTALAALAGVPARERDAPATAARVVDAALGPVIARARADAGARVAADALASDGLGGDAPFALAAGTAAPLTAALVAQADAALALADAPAGDAAAPASAPASDVAAAAALAAARAPRDGDPPILALAAAAAAAHASHAALCRPPSNGGDGGDDRDALAALLQAAERKAREHAAAARAAVGFVPVAARRAYEIAAARREGGPADQVLALEALWASSAASQLAIDVARRGAAPP